MLYGISCVRCHIKQIGLNKQIFHEVVTLKSTNHPQKTQRYLHRRQLLLATGTITPTATHLRWRRPYFRPQRV